MSYIRGIAVQVLLLLASLPGLASASTLIAHRGLYHDTSANNELSENSFQAVVRAYQQGVTGVELDLRTSGDGDLLVTHDMISNRTMTQDSYGGKLNPIDVTLGNQPAVNAIHISDHNDSFWQGSKLKAYGRNGTLITNHDGNLQNLSSLFYNLRLQHPEMFNGNFQFILDIQDPGIFSQAASFVTSQGLQRFVKLKFFASKAVYNNLSYNGADTCYQYMLQNHLNDPDLNIIPQINDGELDVNEDDNAGITKWGHTFTVPEYLQCWATARAQHNNVAYMPIVSASVPVDNTGATAGAAAALNWARGNGRQTMSIVPNPDAGRKVGNVCKLYSFSSTNVRANEFNTAARSAKASFAGSQNVTYIVFDVMSNLAARQVISDFGTYTANLCN